jgi:thiol-disulfide isomerase/thioredoxin
MQEKVIENEPKDFSHLEAASKYAQLANGDKFTKNYIEKIINNIGSSDSFFSLYKGICYKLNVNEKEITALKKISDSVILKTRHTTIINKFRSLEAPNILLRNLKNTLVDIKDFKGQKVFLDFWATWCVYCVEGLPKLMLLKEKYKNVKFILIDTWEYDKEFEKKIKQLFESNKYDFEVLLDKDGKVTNKYFVEGIPSKILLNEKGEIEFLNPSLEELDKYLEKQSNLK